MEKEGWVAAGRGTTATGVTHFFLLFTIMWLFCRSVSEPVFIAFKHICKIQMITRISVCFFKVWCKAVIYMENFRECWDCGHMSTLLDRVWHACMSECGAFALAFSLFKLWVMYLTVHKYCFCSTLPYCLSFSFWFSFVICSYSPVLVSM